MSYSPSCEADVDELLSLEALSREMNEMEAQFNPERQRTPSPPPLERVSFDVSPPKRRRAAAIDLMPPPAYHEEEEEEEEVVPAPAPVAAFPPNLFLPPPPALANPVNLMPPPGDAPEPAPPVVRQVKPGLSRLQITEDCYPLERKSINWDYYEPPLYVLTRQADFGPIGTFEFPELQDFKDIQDKMTHNEPRMNESRIFLSVMLATGAWVQNKGRTSLVLLDPMRIRKRPPMSFLAIEVIPVEGEDDNPFWLFRYYFPKVNPEQTNLWFKCRGITAQYRLMVSRIHAPERQDQGELGGLYGDDFQVIDEENEAREVQAMEAEDGEDGEEKKAARPPPPRRRRVAGMSTMSQYRDRESLLVFSPESIRPMHLLESKWAEQSLTDSTVWGFVPYLVNQPTGAAARSSGRGRARTLFLSNLAESAFRSDPIVYRWLIQKAATMKRPIEEVLFSPAFALFRLLVAPKKNLYNRYFANEDPEIALNHALDELDNGRTFLRNYHTFSLPGIITPASLSKLPIPPILTHTDNPDRRASLFYETMTTASTLRSRLVPEMINQWAQDGKPALTLAQFVRLGYMDPHHYTTVPEGSAAQAGGIQDNTLQSVQSAFNNFREIGEMFVKDGIGIFPAELFAYTSQQHFDEFLLNSTSASSQLCSIALGYWDKGQGVRATIYGAGLSLGLYYTGTTFAGSAAVYGSPAFLIQGPPGAGKSSILYCVKATLGVTEETSLWTPGNTSGYQPVINSSIVDEAMTAMKHVFYIMERSDRVSVKTRTATYGGATPASISHFAGLDPPGAGQALKGILTNGVTKPNTYSSVKTAAGDKRIAAGRTSLYSWNVSIGTNTCNLGVAECALMRRFTLFFGGNHWNNTQELMACVRFGSLTLAPSHYRDLQKKGTLFTKFACATQGIYHMLYMICGLPSIPFDVNFEKFAIRVAHKIAPCFTTADFERTTDRANRMAMGMSFTAAVYRGLLKQQAVNDPRRMSAQFVVETARDTMVNHTDFLGCIPLQMGMDTPQIVHQFLAYCYLKYQLTPIEKKMVKDQCHGGDDKNASQYVIVKIPNFKWVSRTVAYNSSPNISAFAEAAGNELIRISTQLRDVFRPTDRASDYYRKWPPSPFPDGFTLMDPMPWIGDAIARLFSPGPMVQRTSTTSEGLVNMLPCAMFSKTAVKISEKYTGDGPSYCCVAIHHAFLFRPIESVGLGETLMACMAPYIHWERTQSDMYHKFQADASLNRKPKAKAPILVDLPLQSYYNHYERARGNEDAKILPCQIVHAPLRSEAKQLGRQIDYRQLPIKTQYYEYLWIDHVVGTMDLAHAYVPDPANNGGWVFGQVNVPPAQVISMRYSVLAMATAMKLSDVVAPILRACLREAPRTIGPYLQAVAAGMQFVRDNMSNDIDWAWYSTFWHEHMSPNHPIHRLPSCEPLDTFTDLRTFHPAHHCSHGETLQPNGEPLFDSGIYHPFACIKCTTQRRERPIDRQLSRQEEEDEDGIFTVVCDPNHDRPPVQTISREQERIQTIATQTLKSFPCDRLFTAYRSEIDKVLATIK